MKQSVIFSFSFDAKHSKIFLLQKISYFFLGLVTLFLSIRQLYGEDLGFHLHAGKWMIENFSFPDNDTFTYTASENKYVDLNWMYQILLYGIYLLSAAPGIILFNSLLILASLLIVFKGIARHHWFHPWIILSGILAVSPIFEVRPHSLSWLFLNSIIFILEKFFNGSEKIIRLLPLIMLVWVNCHSLFILGLSVIFCYALPVFFSGKNNRKSFLRWSFAALAVCFINPYGWNGFLLPFQQAFALREGNIFKLGIRELQSPFSITEYGFSFPAIFESWHFFDFFLILTGILLMFRFRKLKTHEWLIILLFAFFAFSAVKNIGYFVFAVLPFAIRIVSLNEEKAGKKKKTEKSVAIPRHAKWSGVLFLALCFILVLLIRTNAFYIYYRALYRFGWEWSNSNLPVQATDLILRHHIEGKILNQLDYGGYLGFFTGQKVSIDGRLDVMGEKIFDEQVNAVTDEKKQHLLEKYKPDIIVFSYFVTPDWLVFLQGQNNWRLVHADGNAAMYFKNDFAPSVPAFTAENFIADIPFRSDEEIDRLVKSNHEANFFSPLFQRQYFPEEEHNRVAFCFYYGWLEAAKQIMSHGFSKTTDAYPEMFQNMGSVYFQLHDRERALYCYEKFLEKKIHRQVEERIRFLKNL